MNMLRGAAFLVKGGHWLERRSLTVGGALDAVGSGGLHVAGAVTGGVAVFVSAWLLVAPARLFVPYVALLALFGAQCMYCAMTEIGLGRPLLRPNHRQVPVAWSARFGPRRSFWMYGLVLGAAVFTFVPYALAYCVLAGTALFGSVKTSIEAGALFGVGRSVFVGPCALSKVVVGRSGRYLQFGSRYYPWLSCAAILLLFAIATKSHF